MRIKQSVSIVAAAIMGGVIGSSLVLSEVRAQDYSAIVKSPKALTASAIELTDGNGHIRCKISAESGSPICFFYGPVGRVRMRIGLGGAEEDYAPYIAMNDKDMQERLGIGLNQSTDGKSLSFLRMRDADGRSRLFACHKDGYGPFYSLLDNAGILRGSLSQLDNQKQDASLFLANPTANNYAQVLVSDTGSLLRLDHGETHVGESARANGANLFMSDGAGNLKMHLGVEKGGATRLWRYGKGIYGWVDKQVELKKTG